MKENQTWTLDCVTHVSLISADKSVKTTFHGKDGSQHEGVIVLTIIDNDAQRSFCAGHRFAPAAIGFIHLHASHEGPSFTLSFTAGLCAYLQATCWTHLICHILEKENFPWCSHKLVLPPLVLCIPFVSISHVVSRHGMQRSNLNQIQLWLPSSSLSDKLRMHSAAFAPRLLDAAETTLALCKPIEIMGFRGQQCYSCLKGALLSRPRICAEYTSCRST